MRKIKVCHIITRLILGGAQENTVFTIEGLFDKPNYDILLISGPPIGPEGELVTRVKKRRIPLIIINEMRRNINPFFDVIAFLKLVFCLVKIKPDIVHTHCSKAGILGRWAAKLVGTKIIIHTIHGLPFYAYQGKLVNWFFKLLEIITAQITDKIITVGKVMKEKAIKAHFGNEDKFSIIYSGMEVDKFLSSPSLRDDIRKKYNISDRFVIGCISRLEPLKGHYYLLNAVAKVKSRHPEVVILLVGEGNLRKKIQDETKKLGLDKDTIFAGLVNPEDVPKAISAMDILVHPSLREGLPRSISQAVISGKPVVSFDIDGAKEVVVDGKTGFLVPPCSIDGLADAIEKLINGNQFMTKMLNEQKIYFAKQFSKEQMIREIDKLYQSLLL